MLSVGSTAAAARLNVPATTVLDRRYAYVRGLGRPYTGVQLNGASMPSADPDRNALPLDLFPSALLDNIVTTKTFTPDQPGTATGGLINIDRKSTRLNSSHVAISYAVCCLEKNIDDI